MKIRGKEKVSVIREFVKEIHCDTCKKEITKEMKLYFEVSTSHALWGNDSIDSIQDYDFCSYECLVKNMGQYFLQINETQNYDITIVEVDK
jgi:hypothetical protein